MNVQIITTTNGERLVILPEAEFIAMREAIEDREDADAVRAFHARLAAGEEELVPADVVNRILDGENKIRVWREHRSLSARDLAEKSGISSGYLSQLESGTREGSLDAIKRIAAALAVTMDDIA